MIPAFDPAVLENISKILGDVMTGSEMGKLLARCQVPDVSAQSTKWRRLLDNLAAIQNRDSAGDAVARFIVIAMAPARFLDMKEAFGEARGRLNEALHFAGLSLAEDGRIHRIQAATTLSDVDERARRLKSTLLTRNVHPDVLKFCKTELVQDNYFHAVLEAAKSVAEKIRSKTGLSSDGSQLVDEAFGLSAGLPRLAFNTLQTPTERSEHVGLMSLMKGVFSAFRNPAAHEAKVKWQVTEQDAQELLALVSLLHRRLDQATTTGPPTAPP
jgi:uncharacterized protein (TIGR02391 family)